MGAGFLQGWGGGRHGQWVELDRQPRGLWQLGAPRSRNGGQLFSWDFAAFSGPCGTGPAQATVAWGWRRKADQSPDWPRGHAGLCPCRTES